MNSVERPGAGQRYSLPFAGLAAVLALFVAFSPWPLQSKLRAIGHACCAQIPSHTLKFGGQAMPIDARNTGIYCGVFMVIAIMWLAGRRKAAHFAPWRIRALLMLMVTAMVLDGFDSVAVTHHLRAFYPESNTLRTVTGTFSGMALTLLTMPLFNRLTWRPPDRIAIVEDLGDLGGYLAGAMLLVALLLQTPPIMYFPLSLVSIAGLLLTLTFVNTCIGLVTFRRQNTIGTLGQFVVPALGGLSVACCEIMAIDLWRNTYHW
jgi:uncharacterized membrane protein